jgi:ABC-type antimicrobial peptide transport system ATPase subunit
MENKKLSRETLASIFLCHNTNNSLCQTELDVLPHYTASHTVSFCSHTPIGNNDKNDILTTSKHPHTFYISDIIDFSFI